MKKTLIILLCVIAVPLYSYNALLLVRAWFPAYSNKEEYKSNNTPPAIEQLLVATAPLQFEIRGRDPFALKKIEKPIVTNEKKIISENLKPVKKDITAPAIKVAGIMWNPSNPVAMVKLNGGSTKMVKQGQQLESGISVLVIGKNNIVVSVDGNKFTIIK
jgi:hypothetical protein